MAAAAIQIKPKLRGQIHAKGFILLFPLSLIIIIHSCLAKDIVQAASIILYLTSIQLLYGTSANYYLTDWRSAELDCHMAVFDFPCIHLHIASANTVFISPNQVGFWPMRGFIAPFGPTITEGRGKTGRLVFHGLSSTLCIPALVVAFPRIVSRTELIPLLIGGCLCMALAGPAYVF